MISKSWIIASLTTAFVSAYDLLCGPGQAFCAKMFKNNFSVCFPYVLFPCNSKLWNIWEKYYFWNHQPKVFAYQFLSATFNTISSSKTFVSFPIFGLFMLLKSFLILAKSCTVLWSELSWQAQTLPAVLLCQHGHLHRPANPTAWLAKSVHADLSGTAALVL